jgi:predicted PurR-regulated permease PerM
VRRAPPRTNTPQRITIMVVDIGLVLLAFWVLRGFFGALAWAVVLATATWPLYQRFLALFRPGLRRGLAPLLFTLLIGMVFMVPFGVGVIEIWREMKGIVHWVGNADKNGAPIPLVLQHVPYVGAQITDWWNNNLAAPGAITDLLGRADTGTFARLTQEVGLIIARRLSFFVFTLLTLFFLFRDGHYLTVRFRTLCYRLLGEPGEYLVRLTVTAVRSTADGLVLVGLGEGALLGVAYEVIGVPHPALLGAFTALLAMIPFGAPVIFSLAALLLLADGAVPAAIGLEIFGWAVIYVADYVARPALIGGAAELPFLWVLLGIFGGLATFGLVGLFLGPAIMAGLISLWREWTDPVPRRLAVKSG